MVQRQVSYFPSSPRVVSSPTSQGASPHPPRPRGTVISPDSQEFGQAPPRRPPPTRAPTPSPSPGPPRAASAQARPHLPSDRADVPSSPSPTQASSRSDFFPLFPRTAPRLRRGAPRASRTRRSRQARAPLTPQPGRRGSCCGGSSGCASPPPSRPQPWPPLSLRPAPGRLQTGSASPRPPLRPPEPSVLH